MNNEFENISEEELKRVTNALDALSDNNNQATTKEWNNIMEKSNKEVKKHASRTRMFAIAASVALILAIGGSVFAISNSGDSKNLNTIDKKPTKNEEVETSTTTTTIPLSEEEKLEQGAYTITNLSDNPSVYDGDKLIANLRASGGSFRNLEPSTGHLKFDPTEEQCDGGVDQTVEEQGQMKLVSKDIELSSGKVSDVDAYSRIWSPSMKKYADIKVTCNGETTVTIVDTVTNKSRNLSPEYDAFTEAETDNDFDGVKDRIRTQYQITNVIWIDEQRFVYSRSNYMVDSKGIPYSNGETQFSLADLNKTITLKNAKALPGYTIGSDVSNTMITDAIVENGKTYLVSNPTTSNISPNEEIQVRELETGNILWSKNIKSNSFSTNMTFGVNSNIIYGSYEGTDGTTTGFGYNKVSGTLITPNSTLLVSKN